MFKTNRQVFWFALYDWGNSAFTTLVVTFIYAAYFERAIAPDPETGMVLWAHGITVTALAVALLSPVLGAIADQGNHRRLFLTVTTFACIALTSWLTFIAPGRIYMALAVFVLANIAFEMGMVFYNSFLPDIAGPANIGRVSGFSWGMGYAGGLVCMALALAGFVKTQNPWFGIPLEDGFNIRATCLLAAGWYLVFSLPFLLSVTERKNRSTAPDPARTGFLRRLASTFRVLLRYPHCLRFLAARLIYNDGLVTIIAFGGIYAHGTFGMDFDEIIMFGIVLNLAAGAGAFLFGLMDDKAGARATVLVSLVALTIASVIASAAQSAVWFWIAGIIIGIFLGPNQSASRSLMGRFTPPRHQAEFFGFFAFSGKVSSFLGPLALALVVRATGSQRWGVSTVIIFFIIGGLLLLTVNEEQGRKAAQKAVEPAENP